MANFVLLRYSIVEPASFSNSGWQKSEISSPGGFQKVEFFISGKTYNFHKHYEDALG